MTLPPLTLFRKFIRFFSLTLPYLIAIAEKLYLRRSSHTDETDISKHLLGFLFVWFKVNYK